LAPGSLHGMGHPPLNDNDEDDDRPGQQRENDEVAQMAAIRTTSPVVDFATRRVTFGESTLIRTDHGLTAQLHASGLTPGVYTFWMRVDAPGFPSAAGRLAGHVVGQSGIANFAGHVNVGDIVGNPSIPGFEGTLHDPLHATITLVVRSHGPAEPGRIH